jgi:hypothetical protein
MFAEMRGAVERWWISEVDEELREDRKARDARKWLLAFT